MSPGRCGLRVVLCYVLGGRWTGGEPHEPETTDGLLGGRSAAGLLRHL